MSHPTIRIRLAKQPPLYLLGAVVVASLLPLLMRLFDEAPVQALQRLPIVAAAPVSLERIELDPSPQELPTIAATPTEPEPEVDEVDDVVILDRATPPRGRARRASAPTPRLHAANGPSQRAKAACAHKNKAAARTAYRSLPLGDARRKEVRKACREQGVWIL